MNRLALMTVAGVAAIAAECVYALAAPVTLLNDTFGPAGATRGDDANDPLDVAFHAFTGSLDVIDGTLRGHAGAANARFASSTFAPATLGVGDTITFRFDIRGIRAAGDNGILGFDFGLYNSGGSGAGDDTVASRDAAANDRGVLLHLWDDASNFYSGTIGRDETGQTLDMETGGYVGGYRFADGGWHTYEVAITRTPNGPAAALSYDGVYRNTTTYGGTEMTFDNIQFGTGSVPFDFHLDNLSVTYTAVPEPAMLGALALALGVARRRR